MMECFACWLASGWRWVWIVAAAQRRQNQTGKS